MEKSTIEITENALRALTQAQADSFRRDGFVAIGKLLEDSSIEALREEYDRLFSEARDSDRYRNLSAAKDAPTDSDGEEMLQIMQMCERSLLFRQLLFDERILNIAEDLIGPNLQLFHDQALYKPAHRGGPISWHQDTAYWKCIPANLVSCWLTLDDVDAANGAMHLLPGSHLHPLTHERTEVLLDSGSQVDQSQAVVIELPAGGVMFHHCQTAHHTPPNTTDRQRRAFAIHFMAPGTRSAPTGEYMPVSFGRPILRMRM